MGERDELYHPEVKNGRICKKCKNVSKKKTKPLRMGGFLSSKPVIAWEKIQDVRCAEKDNTRQEKELG